MHQLVTKFRDTKLFTIQKMFGVEAFKSGKVFCWFFPRKNLNKCVHVTKAYKYSCTYVSF